MTQSPYLFGTRRSNSSKQSGEVYFHLEEIKIDSGVYLTELTWSYRVHGVSHDSHYPVRHPGAEEADALMRQMDPTCRIPQRYSPNVIAAAFLTDYDCLPKGTPVLGTSVDQCLALEQYLGRLTWGNRGYEAHFKVLDQHFGPDMVRGVEESLRAIRRNALGVDR